MVGVFRKKEEAAEQQVEFTEKFREQGREQVDTTKKEEKKEATEREVKERVMKELRARLRTENRLTLDNCSGDITGVVKQLEDGKKISEIIIEGASEGSESKMSEGLIELVGVGFNTLKPLDKLGDLFNFLENSLNKKVDEEIEKRYEAYSKTPEGRKRIAEVRREVESKYEVETK